MADQENQIMLVDVNNDAKTVEGGCFVRNDLKNIWNKLRESGKEPVGILLDLNSFNLEILTKTEDDGKEDH